MRRQTNNSNKLDYQTPVFYKNRFWILIPTVNSVKVYFPSSNKNLDWLCKRGSSKRLMFSDMKNSCWVQWRDMTDITALSSFNMQEIRCGWHLNRWYVSLWMFKWFFFVFPFHNRKKNSFWTLYPYTLIKTNEKGTSQKSSVFRTFWTL